MGLKLPHDKQINFKIMSLKVGDVVKQLNHIKEPIGVVIYVYTEDRYLDAEDGRKIWFAGPGDVQVNFETPTRDDSGRVLNEAELKKV